MDRRTANQRVTSIRQVRGVNPSSKKLCFSMIPLMAIALLAELVLLAAGVQPRLNVEDPFVGFSQQVPLLSEQEEAGQPMMVTAANKLRWFNEQRFPKHKPNDTYRIFSVGGFHDLRSTVSRTTLRSPDGCASCCRRPTRRRTGKSSMRAESATPATVSSV